MQHARRDRREGNVLHAIVGLVVHRHPQLVVVMACAELQSVEHRDHLAQAARALQVAVVVNGPHGPSAVTGRVVGLHTVYPHAELREKRGDR